MHVWAVYFNKHVTAVLTFARTGKVESEAIRGRFLDIATYAILGAALADESYGYLDTLRGCTPPETG